MRTFLRFFLSIDWPVQAVGAGALLIWIFKAVVLNRISAPQPFPDLGGVFEGLLSAAISGYVFYIIFALWPEYKARMTMAPYICKQISMIHGSHGNIKRTISDASGIDLFKENIKDEDVLLAFQKIPYNSRPTLYFYVPGRNTGFSWLEFFVYRRMQTVNIVNELLQHSRFMDEKLVSLLTQTIHNKFFFGLEGSVHMPVSNPDLGAWGVGFYDYIEVCQELAQWHDKNVPAIGPKLILSRSAS